MAVPISTWAKIKAEYATGDYTAEQLGKKYGISTVAIEAKVRGTKGKLKAKIESTIQERLIKALAKKAVNENKIAETISGMLDAEQVKIVPSGQEGQSGFADVSPDWRARNEGVKRYFDVTGIPNKQDTRDAPPPLPTRIEVVLIHADS